jgi:hypothetical protein
MNEQSIKDAISTAIWAGTTALEFIGILLLVSTVAVLAICDVAYAQTEAPVPEQSPDPSSGVRETGRRSAPVLSVNGTEASPEERPVLSVDQTEENLFEKDKPVLFDSSVPPAEQSLLEQREGVSGETVLDEGAAPESEPSRGKELEQQKKWRIPLRSRVGIAYDDNIFVSNTNRVGDTILTVTGGISFIYGDWRSRTENFLVADYEAGGTFYVRNSDQDSFNQVATLAGQYRVQRLTTQLRSQYLYLRDAVRDVGELTTRTLINDSLRFIYDLSGKTELTAEAFANITIYQSFFNSYEFGAKAGSNYLITQKVTVGPEIVIGFLSVEESPFQIYQQIRTRATYNATGKVSFEGSAGVQFLQFDSENKTFFVFSLAANYQPFDGTEITLRGYRNIVGSAALESEDFIATGIELAFTQRFFQRFNVTVATGYENDEYISIAEDTNTDRVDNYIFIRPTIAFAFTKWASVSVFYEYRNNFSTESQVAFYDNRAGAALAFQF